MRHAGRFGFKHLMLSLLNLVLTKQLTRLIPLGRDKDEGGEKGGMGKVGGRDDVTGEKNLKRNWRSKSVCDG